MISLSRYMTLISGPNDVSFSPPSLFAGMATKVRLPSPHRPQNVCPALSPNHALSHCCHAARLWAQCHRDTGWENQGVSIHVLWTCSHIHTHTRWGAALTQTHTHMLSQSHWSHMNENPQLVHLKCKRSGYQYFIELVESRNRHD